jgi:glyoxylase-like metal-dependent hydrolase (beta-lactamase superfamily II)
LNEGDVVDLWEGAAPLKVIHTPGHSPGGICLLGDGFALVGDLLFAGGIGRTDLHGGDDEAMAKSLRRIMQLPDSTIVYPGHGPATTIGEERERNPFIESLV